MLTGGENEMMENDQRVRGEHSQEEILRKVIEMATRLQWDARESLTPQEIEAIGKEVGLEPTFIRQALEEFWGEKKPRGKEKTVWKNIFHDPRIRTSFVSAWWACGWALPFALAALMPDPIDGAFFFFGWILYIGGGIVLSAICRPRHPESSQASLKRWSRTELLELLFTLQRALESQKERRAFLSIDVVGSTEMKRSGPEPDVEYSFRRFLEWAERIVKENKGQVHSAAGDGLMAMFPDDVSAVKAAKALQEGIKAFNATYNRLPVPFQIRCGVSAGEVPIEDGTPLGYLHSPVIDRAARLQRCAEPGDILVSGEVQAAALSVLGHFSPLPAPIDGQPAFSWRAGHRKEREAESWQ